ncbi:uncharacterized protein C8Q71DRAFT_724750 [Rhodofomes roseus]|uniref:BZIP domain-containing protein n=1 Tax=Rhodofomes roseus TaxID=34475 RepID=A0ABQ8KDM7_9APHY|nr:uncharacterized protein C8Q71DRAFT_724750 [Rhodofomes roseus]KAH9835462.1 hypothetical protein C8Q71DRAFT_724750 [Rhodofomes roseus]
MLVDNPLQSGFSLNSAFEDFFNMDLLAGPSNAAGSSSSGSSPRSDGSPSESFTGLPPTPPNPYVPDVALNSHPYLDFPLDDDFSKLDLPMPLAAPGFDFMSAFSSAAAQMASPGDSGSGASSSTSGTSPTSIDPQLVTSPTGPKPASEFGESVEEDEDEEGDNEDSMSAMDDALDEELSLAPMKVGGRGKSNRKGTVQSGGVVKRAGSEKKENKPANMLATTSNDPEDWRPTPEEYKKMSSKEKRQLRNKISARNFRVRRKEYITTLEGDIAERDRLIDAIRTELGSMRSENGALRQEIDALKKALLDGRGSVDTPVLPPPAPIPTVSPLLSSGPSSNTSSAPVPPKSPLVTPNTQKDLPTSPRLGARGFWGGASSPFGAGGFTPVHTTLVPEWGSVLSGKPIGRRSPTLQENINPVLNAAPWPGADKAQQQRQQQQQQQQQLGALESFIEMHPFTMKTLDPYRMQLWRNMASQQQTGRSQAQQQSHASPSPSPLSSPNASPSGLAGGLRPHYFAKSGPLSAILSGKAAVNAYPTPPNSPPLAPSLAQNLQPSQPAGGKGQQSQTPTAQQAMLASMASQTLMGKLGSAFWDAFSAKPAAIPVSGTGSASRAAARTLDADKMRRVMEGSAVLKVVDVEPQEKTSPRMAAPQPALARTMSASAVPSASSMNEKKCQLTDVLAESMASLSLGKK